MRCRRMTMGLVLCAVGACLPAGVAEAQDASRGFDLFQTEFECASCHGTAAQGDMGPALAGTRRTIDDVRRQLRAPSSRRMPDFPPEKLDERDLADLYAFLQSLEAPTLADKPTWWNMELLNLPTPALPDRGTMEVHFTHRFSDSITDAGLGGFFGLDSFAFPGFWFSYGLHQRVAPYFGRTSNLATWEYGVKIGLLLDGQLGIPLTAAANIGGTFLDTEGIDTNSRFTMELPIGIRAGPRLAFQVVPLYATNPDEFGDPESDSWSAAIGLTGSLRLSTKYSLDAEYITNVAGFRRAGSVDQWQAGVTIHVRRHLFSLLVSNSTLSTPDFMVGGTIPTGIKSNVRFGFNIVRGFTF